MNAPGISASRDVALFDRFRVPYARTGRALARGVRITAAPGGPSLFAVAPAAHSQPEFFRLLETTVYTELTQHAEAASVAHSIDPSFAPVEPVTDAGGSARSAIFRATDGSILLPFDLDRPLEGLLSEDYIQRGHIRAAQSLARDVYYRLRPLLPRSAQLALRRRFVRMQDHARFPAWPTETALHRLEALLLGLVEELGGGPIPWIDLWPEPYDWAAVLTHDVEHGVGYDRIEAVRGVERDRGLHSAWYFVPERDYQVDDSELERLRGEGCEICVHGLRHDGRDLSPGVFERRLAAMQGYGEQWGAVGFRAPATHRDRALIPALGFDHDSSWSDVARYEPQPGGCCSWAPFFIGDTVELPITLPMDHTLFELLRLPAGKAWLEKAGAIRDAGGMALVLTHPDYLTDEARLAEYALLLDLVAADERVWAALPAEVASWWRRRADTVLVRSRTGWSPSGPGASDARVRLGAPFLEGRAGPRAVP